MSKLRQLIEAANRKCEMAWKVYSYNPEKDNELVDTSKAFDCIAAAQAHKREILEKNPNYTVEIIAESSQKNESKFSSQSTFNKAKDIAKDLQMTLIENSDGSLRRDKIHDYNYPMSIGEVAFYVDDWGYGTQEYNKYKNANIKTLSKGWKIELDNIVSNANKKYKDYNISYSMSSDGKRIYFKIVESKNESSQKNEDFYKYIDDVPTREIAKALKELGIKEPYATQKAKIADKLAKRFGLRRVPTPIEMTSVLDALPYFIEESTQKNEATFKPGDKVSVKSYYKDGNQFITLRNATIIKEITEKEAGQLDPAYNWKEPTGMKYYLVKLDTGYKKAALASDLTLESAQKNEDLSKHPKLQEVWHRWKFNTKYGLHYTSNAKDTQAYLAKITKPNTFWLEDEDTGKAIVQGTPKDLINFMLSHKDTVEESAQINESLRDLNLELADDTNAIAASADKIRQRFEYRTLQNQSYDEKQAEKIYLEVRRELEKAKKMIDACYNKIG